MNIILTGSVAYDYLMTFPGLFKEYILRDKLEHISLSFLVDNMVKRRGGIAPNIAHTLALLGEKPRIMATVGEDFAEYRTKLEEIGVDTSLMKVIPGVFTASFFCNTDQSNAQIASFYPGAMGYAGQLSFCELDDKPDWVVISPNSPDAMVKYPQECQKLGIPYLYDPSQQIPRMTGEALRSGVEGASALMVNDYEFELILKQTGMGLSEILEGCRFTVVTRGEAGATVYVDGDEIQIPIVPPITIADPTGVGDAFRGGFISGFAHGFDWEICGKMGALAATYCLEHDGPQEHFYTPQEFILRYREHFEDGGVLNQLVG
ncbi:MAG TPA: carbohydrate kinase family protein [Chloroflexi bacterium]|nr:carbohydrate kinase family protein [Chloroflexota bacterium]HBY06920.1 carbohydrate kinase family protein [Chloroflexota bacterium]